MPLQAGVGGGGGGRAFVETSGLPGHAFPVDAKSISHHLETMVETMACWNLQQKHHSSLPLFVAGDSLHSRVS